MAQTTTEPERTGERVFKLFCHPEGNVLPPHDPQSYWLVYVEGNILVAMDALEGHTRKMVTRGLGLPHREPRDDERIIRYGEARDPYVLFDATTTGPGL